MNIDRLVPATIAGIALATTLTIGAVEGVKHVSAVAYARGICDEARDARHLVGPYAKCVAAVTADPSEW